MNLQELVSEYQGIIDQQMKRETRGIEYLGKAAAHMLTGLVKHFPYHGRNNSPPRWYTQMTALIDSPEGHNAMNDEEADGRDLDKGYQPSIPTTTDRTTNSAPQ